MRLTVARHQLAERAGDGIVVRLLWDDAAPAGRDVLVEYEDERRELFYVVYPPRDRALEAFYHPNAYYDRAADSHAGIRAA